MAVINGIKEEILLQRLINSEETAFELLFRFYYPGLVTFASQIVLDPDAAEELVEDFFVKFWSDRKKVKQSGSLKSYFFTCIKNRALNYLKKEKISKKVLEELRFMIETDRTYQPDLFLQDQVNAAFEKLQPRTREIFTLSRFNGLSNDEIAKHLNISKRTVETQISNALKILREEFRDYQISPF
ncbi:MAG: RNA polymerase sigma-70 factor [Mangrovibacterium sp.]|nr:RNA polymerase sigma-70 factor [Mangrovibacterium sp.]